MNKKPKTLRRQTWASRTTENTLLLLWNNIIWLFISQFWVLYLTFMSKKSTLWFKKSHNDLLGFFIPWRKQTSTEHNSREVCVWHVCTASHDWLRFCDTNTYTANQKQRLASWRTNQMVGSGGHWRFSIIESRENQEEIVSTETDSRCTMTLRPAAVILDRFAFTRLWN